MSKYEIIEEYHLCLDERSCDWYEKVLQTNYKDTCFQIQNYNVVYSTQIEFLDFNMAKKLFVHCGGRTHQIFLGDGDLSGCKQQIRKENNLGKMLLSGTFEWFDPTNISTQFIERLN